MKGLQIFDVPRRRITALFQLPLRPSNHASTPIRPLAAALPQQSSSFSTTTPLAKGPRKRGGKPGGGRGKKISAPRDSRIKLIKYHLFHPLNPRPLRLSRLRTLRHWTIHRAWHLFRGKQRDAEQLALQKQYQSMYNACEALRLLGEDGLAIQDPAYQYHGDSAPGEVVRPPGARDPVSRTFVRRQDGSLYAADMMGEEERAKEGKGESVVVDVAAAAERQKDAGRLYRIAMEKKGVYSGVPIEYARIQTDTPPRAGWDHGWKRATGLVY